MFQTTTKLTPVPTQAHVYTDHSEINFCYHRLEKFEYRFKVFKTDNLIVFRRAIINNQETLVLYFANWFKNHQLKIECIILDLINEHRLPILVVGTLQ